jgi:Leucine-rich repeat (LRR) protein
MKEFYRKTSLEQFQYYCECQRRNMQFPKLFLLIFCSTFCYQNVNAQSFTGTNYACVAEGEDSSCVLKNFENSEEFQNFLTSNSEFSSTTYNRHYGRHDRKSKSFSSFVYIKLEDMKIKKFPSTFFKKFSGTMNFMGQNISLSELKSEDFRDAIALKILNLSNNEITQLENVQFIYLQNINEIDLSHNKISSIHDGAFDKIGEFLQKLDLSYNQISIFKEEFLWLMMKAISCDINLEHNEITEWEASDKNRTTTTVSNLNLSDNKLKSFKLKNIKLNKLLLANNEIEDFDANFNSIDISNNKIKDLRINSACTFILASNNEISEIFFTAGNSSKIEKFDVSFNNLKESQNFHEFFKNQKKISSLDLSHNFFGTFALEDFADMENLKELSLSNTGISELPFGLFAHLQNLKSLNLSQNNLKEIDFHVFSSLGNLTVLDISGNSLSHIDEYEKLKEVLPNLKNIGLEGT